jgi:hypothetical protein
MGQLSAGGSGEVELWICAYGAVLKLNRKYENIPPGSVHKVLIVVVERSKSWPRRNIIQQGFPRFENPQLLRAKPP